jgi:hypothetical protein
MTSLTLAYPSTKPLSELLQSEGSFRSRLSKLMPNPDVANIHDDFFNESYTFWRLKVPKRLLVPFLVVLTAKIIGIALVYSLLNIEDSGTLWFDANRVFNWTQNAVFLENANLAPRWSYAFVGWDSAWYLSIMTRGYGFTADSYAFPPGFPAFSFLFSFLFGNALVSAALCSMVFGVLWVPLFQLVAEKYVRKQAAFSSAFLFTFSPYVFLFTTVAYSEGVFLFFTLAAWYLFNKSKVAFASGLAAVSVLARFMGSFLILPMVLLSTKKKGVARTRWVSVSLLPIGALFGWLAYCQVKAGDFLAFLHVTEWSSLYTVRTLLLEGLQQKGLGVLQIALQNTSAPLNWLSPFAVIVALVAPLLLIHQLIKIEKSLATYTVLCYVWILMFGALVSVPRYVSVLFPLWIPLTTKLSLNIRFIAFLGIAIAVSFAVGLSLWVDFLNGRFVA